MTADVFDVINKGTKDVPVILSAPHAGTYLPDDLLSTSHLAADALLSTADLGTDIVANAAAGRDIQAIIARYARSYVDLNRCASEIDPAFVEGASWGDYHDFGVRARLRAGYGVIPRCVAQGRVVRFDKLASAEADARLEQVYMPYHQELTRLVRMNKTENGGVLLLDIHSMPNVIAGDIDIAIGDDCGRSAAMRVTEAARSSLMQSGYKVAVNTPFAGGFITKHYGRSGQPVQSLQIEINRRFLLAEGRVNEAACEAVGRDIRVAIEAANTARQPSTYESYDLG